MLIYTGPATAPFWSNFLPLRPRETDVSAQRAPAEASARFPRPHGDAGRARDPEAPPREGPEAALGVAASSGCGQSRRSDRSVRTAARAVLARPDVGVASDALTCNAGTDCLARETSTPSTGRDGPRPRASSSSTGSTVTASRGSRG